MAVRLVGLEYGFKDTTGRVVIEPWFAQACDFKNGLAKVNQSGKWGFIDVTGTVTDEADLEDVYNRSACVAAAESPLGVSDQRGCCGTFTSYRRR